MLVSPNKTSVLTTALGAHHYRFTGLEITAMESPGEINALARFGDNTAAQRDVSTTAHHLVVDRSWIHGTSKLELRRCIMMNSATTAVIDSWLADCHSNASDSQAIVGWNGPGPYLIQNDHLEAGHEVIMFGGGGVTTQNVSPSDITIRGNHITRPVSWKGSSTESCSTRRARTSARSQGDPTRAGARLQGRSTNSRICSTSCSTPRRP